MPWRRARTTSSQTHNRSKGGLIYSARDLRFYGGLPPGNFALSEYTNREYWVLDKRFGTDRIRDSEGVHLLHGHGRRLRDNKARFRREGTRIRETLNTGGWGRGTVWQISYTSRSPQIIGRIYIVRSDTICLPLSTYVQTSRTRTLTFLKSL